MAAAETHLVTPGAALGDDAAPPDVRLVPGDAEDEEYEEPDPPLRPSACTGIGRLAASPLLGVARIAAAPFRILGRRRESLENEAAQLRERRKELAAASVRISDTICKGMGSRFETPAPKRAYDDLRAPVL